MSIVPQERLSENTPFTACDSFLKQFGVGCLLSRCGASKERGIAPVKVFRLLVSLIFKHKSLNMVMTDKGEAFRKDTAYRLLNSTRINWRKLILLLSKRMIEQSIEDLTGEDRINVLVADSSVYDRRRGRKVELLSRVHDHVMNRYVRGFRLLTLGWSDGNTFLPLLYGVMSSSNKKNRYQEECRVDQRSNGGRRRKEAMLKYTDMLCLLLSEARSAGIKATYLLMDSAFSHPGTVISSKRASGTDVITRAKDSRRVHYIFEGRDMTIRGIYRNLRKRRGRARCKAVAEVLLKDPCGKEDVPARIIYVAHRRNGKNWVALLTTDMTTDADEIIRIYGKRWSIEVFFRMCKSCLNLCREFQGRSFDLVNAQVALVFCRYLLLAYEQRCQVDQRTLGRIFHACCDELQDIQLAEALQRLLLHLQDFLERNGALEEELIRKLIDEFVETLPEKLRLILKKVHQPECKAA